MENCGDNCLIMIVLDGEDEKIRVNINSNEYALQKTDVFWVPKQNEYSIANRSTKECAKFVFLNIRSDMCNCLSNKQEYNSLPIVTQLLRRLFHLPKTSR